MTKTLAKIFGVILLLLGVIGLFSTSFVGPAGYFASNAGLDIVNIVAGIVMLAVSSTKSSSAMWLKIVGAIYALLAIIGFAIMTAGGMSNVLGFMSFNNADNWLYLILGLVAFASGFAEMGTMNAMGMNQKGTYHA